ncbi:hypothetical protein P9H28_13290, partial [Paenibacillus barengoltzii]|uniref:hypothetical protein n=1 Tax=Paenibacillus barengoltzii TaxID=343517 RepID=UPI002DC024EB
RWSDSHAARTEAKQHNGYGTQSTSRITAKNSDKSLVFDERTKQSAYKEEVPSGFAFQAS